MNQLKKSRDMSFSISLTYCESFHAFDKTGKTTITTYFTAVGALLLLLALFPKPRFENSHTHRHTHTHARTHTHTHAHTHTHTRTHTHTLSLSLSHPFCYSSLQHSFEHCLSTFWGFSYLLYTLNLIRHKHFMVFNYQLAFERIKKS